MAVYVDPNLDWPKSRKWPFGSVSHMYADSPEELHRLAARLGLKRTWCSDITQPRSKLLHYDLSPRKREQAVRLGALETTHAHMTRFQKCNSQKVT